MPGSIESVPLLILDFALAGGVIWAIWTLREADASKRRKTLAVISLCVVMLFIVLCLLLIPELIVALIGIGVLFIIYYALLQWSNRMWK